MKILRRLINVFRFQTNLGAAKNLKPLLREPLTDEQLRQLDKYFDQYRTKTERKSE